MKSKKVSPDAEREKLKSKVAVGDMVVYRNARGVAVDARVTELGEDAEGNPLVRIEFLGEDGQWHDLGWYDLQSKKHWDETTDKKLKHGKVYLK